MLHQDTKTFYGKYSLYLIYLQKFQNLLNFHETIKSTSIILEGIYVHFAVVVIFQLSYSTFILLFKPIYSKTYYLVFVIGTLNSQMV